MSERLLTARELGELLGLSTGTVLDRFERGDLPGFRLYGGKVGAPVRFRWSEVEAWLETAALGRCRLYLRPRGPRMRACLMLAGSSRCQDAHGPWAGASIVALGGHCAEKGGAIPRRRALADLERLDDRLRHALMYLEEARRALLEALRVLERERETMSREVEVKTLLWRKWSGEPPLTQEEQDAFANIKPEELFYAWAEAVELAWEGDIAAIEEEATDFGAWREADDPG